MSIELQIDSPFEINLAYTVESHGWVALMPWHWDSSLLRLEPWV